MRLLLLTPHLPYPPRQGASIRNYNFIKHLAQRHTVDLLTFLAPSEMLTSENPLHQLCKRIATVAQPQRSLRQRAWETLASPLPDMALRDAAPAMHAYVAQWTSSAATEALCGGAQRVPASGSDLCCYDLVQVEE